MFRTLFTSAVIIAAMSTQASAINIQDDAAVAAAGNAILQGVIEKVKAGQVFGLSVKDRAEAIDDKVTHKSDAEKSDENAG